MTIVKMPFEYPLIGSIDGINIHKLPDYQYFIDDNGRSCYVTFKGASFIWSEAFLTMELHEKIQLAILAHELKGIL